MYANPSRNSDKDETEKKKTKRAIAKYFALYANVKLEAKAFCINTQTIKGSPFLYYRNLPIGSSPFSSTNTTSGCYQTYPDKYRLKITPFGN